MSRRVSTKTKSDPEWRITNTSEKDARVLWARSAERCAICRTKLSFNAAHGAAETLGEMAHIVGEKPASPRGASRLSSAERAGYHNLILLCRHHHRKVDTDPGRFPIEELHRLKASHETWVDETLGVQVDPDKLVTGALIDEITTSLSLESWYPQSESAFRDRVPASWADARGPLNRILLGAIWPKKPQPLIRSIKALIETFNTYIDLVLTNVDLAGKVLKPDESYRSWMKPSYQSYLREEEENVWSNVCIALLLRFTVDLNTYAEMVRSHVNPMYFRVHGQFTVHDDMGIRHDMVPHIIRPSAHTAEAYLMHAVKTCEQTLANYKKHYPDQGALLIPSLLSILASWNALPQAAMKRIKKLSQAVAMPVKPRRMKI